MESQLADRIVTRALPTGGTALGEEALRETLSDLVPEPDAWTVVLPPDEGASYSNVYVLAGRCVYLLRASVEQPADVSKSECGCDLYPITPTARFFVSFARVPANYRDHRGTKTIGQWRFDFGDGAEMDFRLETESMPGTSAHEGAPGVFAAALAERIAER